MLGSVVRIYGCVLYMFFLILYGLFGILYLQKVLLKNCDATDYNSDEIVESLRQFSEILVWGDQNDGAIMDFFWEQNCLELLIRYIEKRKDRNVCVQLLQTLNILFENLTNNRAIYYLLSQNHTNGIILHDFDFSDEEVIGYYIAFLKSLSFRVNEDTINFFYDEAQSSFPLYQRALRFFNHSETMVRIAVRTITLNIFKVRNVPCAMYVYACTSVPYFSHLTEEMRKTASAINDSICFHNRLVNRSRIEDLVAETSDHLHYIDDIFSLGIPDLTNVLFFILLQRLFLPLYVHSLTKRHLPNNSTNNYKGSSRGYFFHAVSMFLLSQVFTILHQPDLIRVLSEAILIGDLTLLCPAAQATSGEATGDVVAHLRAAHHGKRAVKMSPPGSRLAAFLRTIAGCGCQISSVENVQAASSTLDEDIAKCSLAIQDYSAVNNKSNISSDENQSGVPRDSSSPTSSSSSSDFASQIAVTPLAVPSPPQHDPSERNERPDEAHSQPSAGSGFSLTSKPFLRALFRSLEVGPGTDYDTFFALSLLIAIKQNGGEDEGTLALAQLHTPTQESPCNSMLITKLLDIISDAAKMGSRVRVATLNLALFLLVLITRDSSRVCQLTENQRQQVQATFMESHLLLHNLYMGLSPSTLLENTAFLFNHVTDALKLSSYQSEGNLTETHKTPAMSPQHGGSLGGSPYATLPFTELEHIQRAVAVFLCLHGYLSTYIFPGTNGGGEPQNEVKPPALERVSALSSFGNIPTSGKVVVSVSDPIDIAAHQIFSCEIEHESGRTEKRYLIISDVQFILVEPSPRKIGWGTVTFAGLLQDTVLKMDATDCHSLSIIVYKPGERSGLTIARIITEAAGTNSVSSQVPTSSPPNVFPLMNAKLRFQNAIQCSTICTLVTQQSERIRASKQVKLRRLLNVQDKPQRPPVHATVLGASSGNRVEAFELRQPNHRADLDDLKRTRLLDMASRRLRTGALPPTNALRRTPASSPVILVAPVSPSLSTALDPSPKESGDKSTVKIQEIPMVDLSRKQTTEASAATSSE
ncbi:unnamed protein product [Mesocestoides corti]|uniref:FPL domain-containing protein n=1 Tax=Mesocestoides corti TaxID=53468 RepID=A0A158QT72_MESCO|nr:unnamed protein product [Mesocestoides corti]